MTPGSGSARRRTNTGARFDVAFSPVLFIAGVLAALASIPWLLSVSASVPPPHIAAVQPGSPACFEEPRTGGPSYVARLRAVGDDDARLVKERRASCDESARPQRLAPSRRAPAHLERWLGQEPATLGHAGGARLVDDASRSFEIAQKSGKTDRQDDPHPASLNGDVHAPRGPPTHPFV
jgi:hypothetical protein